MSKSKFHIIICLIGISFGLKAQDSELKFQDDFGNSITIKNFKEVSEYLNKDFFIQNINGKQFLSDNENSDHEFDFEISDMKKINRNNFKFKIKAYPRAKDIETILKYLGGGQIYRLKIKRTSNGVELKNLKYLYSIT